MRGSRLKIPMPVSVRSVFPAVDFSRLILYAHSSIGEVGKLLGAKWKELDDAEKKPYIDQAARDKERAEEEKAAYDVCHFYLAQSTCTDRIYSRTRRLEVARTKRTKNESTRYHKASPSRYTISLLIAFLFSSEPFIFRVPPSRC